MDEEVRLIGAGESIERSVLTMKLIGRTSLDSRLILNGNVEIVLTKRHVRALRNK